MTDKQITETPAMAKSVRNASPAARDAIIRAHLGSDANDERVRVLSEVFERLLAAGRYALAASSHGHA